MRIVVGIATFKGREKALKSAIKSLQGQVDEIIIYDNEVNPNKADNGKFYGLSQIKEHCYFLTCDDDLIYPPNYVGNMISSIDYYGCIVTHHGRVLTGVNRSYYTGHNAYSCLRTVGRDMPIDVCGTGVTGFRTDYFLPKNIHNAKDLKMSDLVFSLEAWKQGKEMKILSHNYGWIKQYPINLEESIYNTELNNTRQNELANEIHGYKVAKVNKRFKDKAL